MNEKDKDKLYKYLELKTKIDFIDNVISVSLAIILWIINWHFWAGLLIILFIIGNIGSYKDRIRIEKKVFGEKV